MASLFPKKRFAKLTAVQETANAKERFPLMAIITGMSSAQRTKWCARRICKIGSPLGCYSKLLLKACTDHPETTEYERQKGHLLCTSASAQDEATRETLSLYSAADLMLIFHVTHSKDNM